MCNKPCNTCIEIYCPWKCFDWWTWQEARADYEEAHGYFQEGIKEVMGEIKKHIKFQEWEDETENSKGIWTFEIDDNKWQGLLRKWGIEK